MAEKNPLKFYDTVMKQKVTEHKVQRAKTFEGHADGELPKKRVLKKGRSLELKSRVTITTWHTTLVFRHHFQVRRTHIFKA